MDKYNASLKFWKANVTCKWQRKTVAFVVFLTWYLMIAEI